MAEQTMAEKPTAEKIAPWWQRILRRAVDGLRSGFGLFRRSQAPSSRTGEEVSNSNVEAEDSGARSIAAEPQTQDEAKLQIAEEEEETELNRTSPHPESNSAAAEEQAMEAAAAQNTDLHQPEGETTAADGPGQSVEPEPAQNPVEEQNPAEEPTEVELPNEELQVAVEEEEAALNEIPSTAEPESNAAQEHTVESALEVNDDLEQAEALPSTANEPIVITAPETSPGPDPQEREAEAPAPEPAEAIESVPDASTEKVTREETIVAEIEEEEIPDPEPVETEGPEPEAHEAFEPIADPPCEEAVVAESEAVAEVAVELPAGTDATEEPDATQPADQVIELAHEEDQNANSSVEDAVISQAKDAPEEGVVTEPAEPEKPLEIERAQENASFETVEPMPMEAAPDQEETQAEAVAALELESAFEDAPVVDEPIGAEELPESEGTLSEAIPVVEETNIEGEGTIDAERAESTDAPFPVSASTEASVAEPETPVAAPELNASEPEAPVSAPEVNASEPEAAVAEPKPPAAEPDTSVAEPPPPVAEPVSPGTLPVSAEPTAEERKKSDKVAAAMKARSQTEEQSPFSVAVGKIYEGPLDLLLDLIRKQDLDIYDIPIAKITAQFLAYVDRLRAGDMDVAGDFIYTAALLIHIKSKMLLPREPAGPDDAGDDPRHELVERLLEHERFKNAAQMLQQKQLLEAATWTRPGLREFGEEADAEAEIAADTVDLVRVFREVLERAANRPVMNLEEDAVTVGQMIRFLARRLNMDDRPVALRRLLSQTQSERMLIAMFLALLEMVRLQAVLLRQDRQFSEIFVKKHTGFDALMSEGLENAKDDWR